MEEYVNGYIERKHDGSLEGRLTIDGVDVSPIIAQMFKRNGKTYLWLRRKDLMEYDMQEHCYKTRKRRPVWESYLEKQMDGSVVSFRGEFAFLRYRYSIEGVWDNVLGMEKGRINLFVERLPMEQQTILNGIRKRRNND